MDKFHVCVATSSVQHLFAKASISFAFFCPKLAAKYKVCSDGGNRQITHSQGRGNTFEGGEREGSVCRNGGDKKKRDGNSGTGDRVPGYIINTTGRNLRFPQGLKQKHCSHFVDTTILCTKNL